MLIGLSAVLFALLDGRIAGISGIVGGLLKPGEGDRAWRIAFIAGMFAAPWLYQAFAGAPEIEIDAGAGVIVAAGLLVGVGTRYGSGCTSGHGVCGLSRRSPRSLAATAAFIVAGFVVVWLTRHALGI